MLLINNLYGEYDANTAEGRGANAASNLMKYFIEGKRIAEQKVKQLLKREIDPVEAFKNTAIEKFAQAYIPYTEINEETGEINIEYGLAFAAVYIDALDSDKDGVLSVSDLGPIGSVIDQIEPNGRITKGKMFAWFVFQDCVDVYNGVISPNEAAKSFMWANNNPVFVIEKLREIYFKLNLKQKEEEFRVPEPVRSC